MLVKTNFDDSDLCVALNTHDRTTLVDDTRGIIKVPVLSVRAFYGGLATNFIYTTLVESDSSLLKWEMSPNCR